MTQKQILEAWANRDNKYGYEIGKDLLINGAYINNIGISKRDIENEYLDYNEDNYYLIIDFCNGNYAAIEEIIFIDTLTLHYLYR